MSVRVMAAVWDLPLPPSEKLVLLALADWAHDDGKCWPSIKAVADKSGVSQRTVQRMLRGAEKSGLLKRKEIVGKGCEYRLIPNGASPLKRTDEPALPLGEMQGYHPPESHYVYRINCPTTGEFYVGARSCFGAIADDPYMGSGEWTKVVRQAQLPLTKVVVEVAESRETLGIAEQKHVAAALLDSLCRNRKNASPKCLVGTGNRGDKVSPRQNVAATNEAETPDTVSPNTLGTIISAEAKASTPRAKLSAPDGVSDVQWKAFKAQRKKPLNDHSYALLCNKLRSLAEDGWPPGGMIDLAIERGWETVFAPRNQGNGRTNGMAGHQPDGLSPTTRAARDVFGPITASH